MKVVQKGEKLGAWSSTSINLVLKMIDFEKSRSGPNIYACSQTGHEKKRLSFPPRWPESGPNRGGIEIFNATSYRQL